VTGVDVGDDNADAGLLPEPLDQPARRFDGEATPRSGRPHHPGDLGDVVREATAFP